METYTHAYHAGESSEDSSRADAGGSGRTHPAQPRASNVLGQTISHHAAGLQQDVHHAQRETAADTGWGENQATVHGGELRRHRHTALQRTVRHVGQRRLRRTERGARRQGPRQEGRRRHRTDRHQRCHHTQERGPEEHHHRAHPAEDGDGDVPDGGPRGRVVGVPAGGLGAEAAGAGPRGVHRERGGPRAAEDPAVADGDPAGAGGAGGARARDGPAAPLTSAPPAVRARVSRARLTPRPNVCNK